MSSKEDRAAKAAKKKNFYRIIAGVACAALLLTAILPDMHALFGCREVLTKAFDGSQERLTALRHHGFVPAPGAVTRHDGTPIMDYWAHRA